MIELSFFNFSHRLCNSIETIWPRKYYQIYLNTDRSHPLDHPIIDYTIKTRTNEMRLSNCNQSQTKTTVRVLAPCNLHKTYHLRFYSKVIAKPSSQTFVQESTYNVDVLNNITQRLFLIFCYMYSFS